MSPRFDHLCVHSETSGRRQWPATAARYAAALAIPALLAGLMVAFVALGPHSASAAHVAPVEVPGNLTCGEVRHDLIEAPKIEPVVSGTTSFSVQGATHSVTITNVQDSRFDWSSTIGITVVVVKGGPNANVYTYDAGSLGDTGLHAPISPNTGQPYGLSHASLCYGGAAGVPGAGEQPAPEGPVLQPPGAE
ncbi:MAG: hypothetical protein U1B78_00880, partial [Dehalococcoidia bacterium]|nr:hypothetical protein [Dehalococcoidia bacterium]